MPAAYVDQSADGLLHTLVHGVIGTSRFQVLDTAHLLRDGFAIGAGIIGASHYLTFAGPGFAFSEVLACVEVEPETPVLAGRFVHHGLSRTAYPAGLAYNFEAQRGSWAELRADAAAIERGARAVRSYDAAFGLVEVFPAAPDGRAPKTVVHGRFRVRDHALDVETVHVYPNEDAVVLTRSGILFDHHRVTPRRAQ